MMSNAREEYLFMFSIMVLEASTSNRLVVFYPPLNLLPLILLRPLRLFFPAPQIRKWRIVLLKLSHCMFAAVIVVFERLRGNRRQHAAWGPNNDKMKPALGLGISMFNRSSVLSSRRLQVAGSRLGLGGGLHATTTSAASSVRLDDHLEGPSQSRINRLAGEDSVPEELRRIRMGIEELSRKMDAILSQRGGRRMDADQD
ncbi:hypothetical protein K440DRAFT_621656 [Wilcoxina mikolae CBS 423.85]|nr:hypothetical protein K440DRAFT_621656 [Wilcoxina mikolae CBS 423.85]